LRKQYQARLPQTRVGLNVEETLAAKARIAVHLSPVALTENKMALQLLLHERQDVARPRYNSYFLPAVSATVQVSFSWDHWLSLSIRKGVRPLTPASLPLFYVDFLTST